MIEQQVTNPNAVRYILAMLLGMVLSLGTVTVQAQGCVPHDDDNPLCNPNAVVRDLADEIADNTAKIADNTAKIAENTKAIEGNDADTNGSCDANTIADYQMAMLPIKC